MGRKHTNLDEDEINLNKLIKLINEQRTYLAPSDIHGVGVFACADIKEGEKLFKFPVGELKKFSCDFLIENGANEDILNHLKKFYFSSENLFYLNYDFSLPHCMYINHSEDGNVNLDNEEPRYKTNRFIKKDEELSMNYKKFLDKAYLIEYD